VPVEQVREARTQVVLHDRREATLWNAMSPPMGFSLKA
jgi:hypothetical protein